MKNQVNGVQALKNHIDGLREKFGKVYTCEIWYRFSSFGELEKECMYRDIIALSTEDAIKIAKGLRLGVFHVEVKSINQQKSA